MKRLIQSNLILIFLFLLLLLACEEPQDEVVPVPGQQTIKVKGTLHVFDPVEIYNNTGQQGSNFAQLDGSGQIELEGFEPDMMEIRQSHIAILKNDGNIEFENGEFYFGGSNNDSIFGSYRGSGTKLDVGFDAKFLLTINGGTGKYQGASGHLGEIIRLQAGNGNKVYAMYFDGNIALPGEVQLTKIYP